jgi:hypothetical protein
MVSGEMNASVVWASEGVPERNHIGEMEIHVPLQRSSP